MEKSETVKRWIVMENTNAEDTKGAIRIGTEVVQAADYDTLAAQVRELRDALQGAGSVVTRLAEEKRELMQSIVTTREERTKFMGMISSDSLAVSCQTLGQYRTLLLSLLALKPTTEAGGGETTCKLCGVPASKHGMGCYFSREESK
jgi:uncharacterized ferredoxin-like protein